MGISPFIEKMIQSGQLDFKEGRCEILDIRLIFIRASTFASLLESIYERHGDEVFDMLFEMGVAHGQTVVNDIGRNRGVTKKEMFTDYTESANVMGLGRISVEKLDMEEKELVMKVEDSPIPEQFKRSDILPDVDRPVDEFHRGLYYGMGKEVFETDVTATEERCEYLGDDYCIIHVQASENVEDQ